MNMAILSLAAVVVDASECCEGALQAAMVSPWMSGLVVVAVVVAASVCMWPCSVGFHEAWALQVVRGLSRAARFGV